MADVMKLMNTAEAEECVRDIADHLSEVGGHIATARRLALDLRERRGWAVLQNSNGQAYKSWRECLMDRLQKSQATVYRLVLAAEVEQDVRSVSHSEKNPQVSTRQAVELSGLDKNERQTVYAEATAGGAKPTPAKLRDLAAKVQLEGLPAEEQQKKIEKSKRRVRRQAAQVDRQHQLGKADKSRYFYREALKLIKRARLAARRGGYHAKTVVKADVALIQREGKALMREVKGVLARLDRFRAALGGKELPELNEAA